MDYYYIVYMHLELCLYLTVAFKVLSLFHGKHQCINNDCFCGGVLDLGL